MICTMVGVIDSSSLNQYSPGSVGNLLDQFIVIPPVLLFRRGGLDHCSTCLLVQPALGSG